MTIRPEKPGEFAELYKLIETAFRTARVADGDEQNFTARLRAGTGYIPALALVAEEDGKLAGQVMLTRFAVETEGGDGEILLVAPLSVVLEYRNRGVGAALMREGLRRAAAMGFRAALLAGDPAYYGRFGFRRSTGFGIGNTDGIPEEYVLAVELMPGALDGMNGTVTFAGM